MVTTACLPDFSTRRVENRTEFLGAVQLSRSQVSAMAGTWRSGSPHFATGRWTPDCVRASGCTR